jgi:hypothetical protein
MKLNSTSLIKFQATWYNSLKFCRVRGMKLGTVEDVATERLIARYLNKTGMLDIVTNY